MGTQVVRYKSPAAEKQNDQVKGLHRIRKQHPWSSYVDARALMAIVAYLHCSYKKIKLQLTTEDMCHFIECGSFKRFTKVRKVDLEEAFDGLPPREIVEVVSNLVPFLVSEGALISEYEHTGETYRICCDELRVLDHTHEQMYPKKRKKFQH